MSVIEAMLTGLPVVATDIRGPREQVVDGETGLLVPPREPCRRWPPRCAAWRPTRRCARAWARPAAPARSSATTRRAVVARTLDLLGL